MSFPTTSVLDDFNRANENPLSDGGKWTSSIFGDSGLRVQSNRAVPGGSTWADSYWNVATFTDCEVFCTNPATTGGSLELCARITNPGGAVSCYFLDITGSTWTIWKTVAGAQSQIPGSGSQALAAGSKVGFSVIGNTLTAYYYNGSAWAQVLQVTDSALAGPGYIGLTLNSNRAADDFGGGAVVTGTSTVGADLGSDYGLRALARADLASVYGLRAFAGADLAAAYGLAVSVAAGLQAGYDLRALVGADASVSYALRGFAAATFGSAYDLRAFVGGDLEAVYGLRARAGADMSAAYALLGLGVASALLSASYDLREQAGVSLGAAYALRTLAFGDLAAAYALRGLAGASLGAAYGLAGSTTADLVAAYALRVSVSAEAQATYALRALARGDFAAAYALTGRAAADLSAAYALTHAASRAARLAAVTAPRSSDGAVAPRTLATVSPREG